MRDGTYKTKDWKSLEGKEIRNIQIKNYEDYEENPSKHPDFSIIIILNNGDEIELSNQEYYPDVELRIKEVKILDYSEQEEYIRNRKEVEK